jgi:hypothetical protein
MAQTEAHGAPGHDKQILHVTVFAPRFPDQPKEFDWDKHLSVGDAAAQAASAFGYAPGTYSLAKDDKALDRDKQLVAAGVRDGDELELVDVGGGV